MRSIGANSISLLAPRDDVTADHVMPPGFVNVPVIDEDAGAKLFGRRAAGASMGILIADEHAPIRTKLLDILHQVGVPGREVQVSSSAAEAWDVFSRARPRLVFMELLADDPQGGLELVHRMLDADPAVKLVLVTADSPSSPTVRAAVRAGIFAVVEKPLRHEKIRQVLQEIESEEGGIERFR